MFVDTGCIERRPEFVEFVFAHDRIVPSAFSLQILISRVDRSDNVNPQGKETCKFIRSVINIASSCLFPTNNNKIY